MKILVPVKRVVDPYVKIHINASQTDVDAQHAKHGMNPFDEIAVEQAAQWRTQQLATEVIALSCGPSSVTEVLRAALARGADSAIGVTTDTPLEPLAVAKVLAHFAKEHSVDCILMGKQAIDDDCNQTAQMVAALLGWPQATFVSSIEKKGEALQCTREIDGGLQVVSVTLPAVISCDLRLNTPGPIPLPKIMKAKSKPLVTHALETLNLEVAPRLKVLSVKAPPARPAGEILEDVSTLISRLKDKEKVL